MTRRPAVALGGALVLVAFVVLQCTGPERTNPAIDDARRLEATVSVPGEVQNMLRRACYDCHSDETRWPWYSSVAPISWLVVGDVREARAELNFSRWSEYHRYDRADLLDKACELAKKGEMPLPAYVRLHPEARLSPADLEAFCAWTATEAARLTRKRAVRLIVGTR
jgi:hypothetical protein